MGTASVGSSLRIATSSSPGTLGSVSGGGLVNGSSSVSSVVGVSAGGSTLGAGSTLATGGGESEPDAMAGGDPLAGFFTWTFGGRCDRRGLGMAGEVTTLLRRGTSGAPDERAVGTAETFGGVLVACG